MPNLSSDKHHRDTICKQIYAVVLKNQIQFSGTGHGIKMEQKQKNTSRGKLNRKDKKKITKSKKIGDIHKSVTRQKKKNEMLQLFLDRCYPIFIIQY